jgi:hypothetical protein
MLNSQVVKARVIYFYVIFPNQHTLMLIEGKGHVYQLQFRPLVWMKINSPAVLHDIQPIL